MVEPRGSRWLLLVHQLPPRPSNLRVRIWRRLQQIGAAVLRNSIYVLPNTPETREDFAWVRAEITAHAGQVSLLEANSIDGYTDDELVRQFQRDRDADYHRLAGDVRRVLRRPRGRASRRAAPQPELRKLQERFAAITAIDHFKAPAADDARQALEDLQTSLSPPNGASGAGEGALHREDFRGRVWVTRPRPGVDRMASAWLIRRFIAPDARFAFAAPQARMTKRRIPFDMPDVEFGHHGSDCTFERLVRRFRISDTGVARLAHVVHDLDLKEARYGLPEGVAVGRLVEGLRAAYTDDAELLEQGIVVMEALYRSYAREATSAPRRPRPRKSSKARRA